MAKILYGVSGEGSGHSSRAKLIAKHLIEQGHQVKIVSYDRGYRNLKDDFDVLEIVGLSISSRNNKVSIWNTISDNFSKLPDGQRALRKLKALFSEFKPDCVLTDFEPSTAYLAKHYDLPLISIDNQHRMRYMEIDYPTKLIKDALIAKAAIKAIVPKPSYSLIVSFHFSKLKNDHSEVFPPILRPRVKDYKPTDGDHILVYISFGFERLLEYIQAYPREKFIVYGIKNPQEKDKPNNIEYKEFSDHGFLSDLAACKGVIATAGFTLLSESLYFKKPLLAFTMKGQFEQQLNAHMLDTLKLGKQGGSPPSKNAISAFLYELEDFKPTLEAYSGFGNELLLTRLDELISKYTKP